MLCGSLLELGSFLFMNDLETNVKLIKKHEKEANVQWPSKTWKTVAETILIKKQQSGYLEAKYKEMRGGLRLFHNPEISKTPLYCRRHTLTT